MGRKSSTTAVSKISTAALPAVPSMTSSGQKSSILKSAFAPSTFQLHLFASVIQSFESHQLRIHDTSNGRLRCTHAARPGARITCLDWGYYRTSQQQNRDVHSRKKRKQERDSYQAEDAVIAYGTNTSEICIFLPAEAKLVGTLTGHHERGVKAFRFSLHDYSEGWSIGEDGTLVQWDLSKGQAIRNISLPDHEICTLATPIHHRPELLCASSTPYTIDYSSSDDFRIEPFDSFKNTVRSLFRSGSHNQDGEQYFLAADADRYINVYDIEQRRIIRTLIVGSEAETMDLFSPSPDTNEALSQQVLAVVTKTGIVELFSQPFTRPQTVNGDLKSSRKNLTKKASASVKLLSSGAKSNAVPVFAASLQGPELIVASTEGGVDVSFQKIRWQDEGTGELLFEGPKDVLRATRNSTLNTATMNGVKDMSKVDVDESRTVVINDGGLTGSQEDAIEIATSEEEENNASEFDSEASIDEDFQSAHEADEVDADEVSGSDEEMEDVQEEAKERGPDADGQEDTGKTELETDQEPLSFGEIMAAQQQKTITIADAFEHESSTIAVTKSGKLAISSGMSLGTVLSQALRTNDRALLESCLHTTDIDIVKNTIQRLDSSLASLLLSKLAERLAIRPGRYGHLLTWVQWTCIAHGGAIASQPDVTKKIQSLYKVLSQRAKSLDNLLLLKGKLDMLDAQLTFRRELQAQHALRRENQDEPGMIYIEGQKDNWSSEDEDSDNEGPRLIKDRRRKKPRKALGEVIAQGESLSEEEEEDEEMPLTNGISHQESDSEDEDDDEDEDGTTTRAKKGVIDNEADISSVDEEDDDDDEIDDEEDSDMDDFINDDDEDDSVSGEEEEEEEEDDDEENEVNIDTTGDAKRVIEKPKAKRSRYH